MSELVKYNLNRASATEIAEHLRACDNYFVPPLSGRVVISDYVKKIASKATRFEAWANGVLVGLVATYCNDQEKNIAYITSVSVLQDWTSKGIAAYLVSRCIQHVNELGIKQICLEVTRDNTPAIRLYEKSGFVTIKVDDPCITMHLYLKSGEKHEQQS